jgi:hypothetical protein
MNDHLKDVSTSIFDALLSILLISFIFLFDFKPQTLLYRYLVLQLPFAYRIDVPIGCTWAFLGPIKIGYSFWAYFCMEIVIRSGLHFLFVRMY